MYLKLAAVAAISAFVSTAALAQTQTASDKWVNGRHQN
jgi:hypothetical protein